MKKISKKLSLNAETVRVLSGPELEQALGGNGPAAVGETVRNTIMRVNPSLAAAAAAPCLRHSVAAAAIACRLTGGVHTAPCAFR
jgi:hypothetical protein